LAGAVLFFRGGKQTFPSWETRSPNSSRKTNKDRVIFVITKRPLGHAGPQGELLASVIGFVMNIKFPHEESLSFVFTLFVYIKKRSAFHGVPLIRFKCLSDVLWQLGSEPPLS